MEGLQLIFVPGRKSISEAVEASKSWYTYHSENNAECLSVFASYINDTVANSPLYSAHDTVVALCCLSDIVMKSSSREFHLAKSIIGDTVTALMDSFDDKAMIEPLRDKDIKTLLKVTWALRHLVTPIDLMCMHVL